MKIAFFDCQFGAAGDMLLGALLSAGLPEQQWRNEINKIDLPAGSFKINISDAMRGGIASKKVDVEIPDSHEERRLKEIIDIIDKSSIAAKAKALASKIFRRLAEAEGVKEAKLVREWVREKLRIASVKKPPT